MFIRQNDTGKVAIGVAVDIADGYTMNTALTLTSADSARAILGDDTTVDISGYTMAAVTSCDGMYQLTLQTGITDTTGPLDIIIEDVDRILPIYQRFYVVEEEVYDALYAPSAAGFAATSTITIAQLAAAAPPATPTMEEAIMYLYTEYVRNKTVTDGPSNLKEVYDDAGSGVIYKKTVTDSASILTVAEAVSGP